MKSSTNVHSTRSLPSGSSPAAIPLTRSPPGATAASAVAPASGPPSSSLASSPHPATAASRRRRSHRSDVPGAGISPSSPRGAGRASRGPWQEPTADGAVDPAGHRCEAGGGVDATRARRRLSAPTRPRPTLLRIAQRATVGRIARRRAPATSPSRCERDRAPRLPLAVRHALGLEQSRAAVTRCCHSLETGSFRSRCHSLVAHVELDRAGFLAATLRCVGRPIAVARERCSRRAAALHHSGSALVDALRRRCVCVPGRHRWRAGRACPASMARPIDCGPAWIASVTAGGAGHARERATRSDRSRQ